MLYRNVSTAFWEDRKVVEDFTPEDKYFYLYLFTNPHTSLTGCYELGFQQAAIETGYNKETIARLIERFQHVHKVIMYDHETREVLLLNWYKHNWTASPKCEKGVKAQTRDIKSEALRNYIDTVCIPYVYGIPDGKYGISNEKYGISSNSNSNRNSMSNSKSNSNSPWALMGIGEEE